ncbi:MAG: hypothetical protein OXI34_01965 [Chloroflexota bacterium]|nr:hypothetical protein [Chloroflexota bacterium]MDE2948840.1 hypothetical protein [Chloroflexota bacterium]
MALKRSDVLITRPCGMDVYRRYRATGLGWGFLPEPDRRGLPPDEEMMRDVDEAHRCGVKFQGRVELDADWMGMIDFDSNFMESTVRDLNNRPAVTWWVHTYKGHPSYHFCTNAPGYRVYLMYQLRRVMEAGTDWLMIDSAIPTIAALNARYGGCFCEHCMAGFREYLKANLSAAERETWKIESIETFCYRDFLLNHGIGDERYRAEILAYPPVIPLAKDFFDYQWREVNALFREFKQCAQEFGADVPMSSNSPFYWAEFMYAVDAHDFYTNEMQYLPPEEEILPVDPVYTFKLADALDRLLAITGVPRAFEPCRIKDRPGHIRLWIAQAYAHGHVFMAPDKMWTQRIAGQPDRWYHSKPGDYESLYHFLRDYPELFDHYESVASVALIFSNNAVRQHLGDRLSSGHLGGQNRSAPATDLAAASYALSRANLPFCLIVAGDVWVEDRLLDADLAPYQLILRFEPSHLNAEQEDKLLEAGDRLATWSGADDLLNRVERAVKVTGAENLSVLLRHQPKRGDSPVVCHLLNSNYDLEADAFRPLQNIRLELNGSLLGNAISRATLYAPGRAPRAVDCRRAGVDTLVTVPELDMWAVVKLE